jgi:succinate dehydrogenase / fumarate reductase flavoprotein subunit
MEVGPTCHYVMGGVEVDPDTGMSTVAGLFAAGECSGGMHGSNRLGGNSLSDLLVFGRRCGAGASSYVDGLAGVRPAVHVDDVAEAEKRALLPFSSATEGGENPFVVHLELQKTMNDLVGIIRKEDEMELALKALQDIAVRTRTVSVAGGRLFNPGWHLALDLRNMLLVSLCVAKAALERQESRGGHTRDDYPVMDSDWRHVLLVLTALGEDNVNLERKEQLPMRPELLDLFELDELKKYYTGEEIGGHRADSADGSGEEKA